MFHSDVLRDTVGRLKAQTVSEKLFKSSGQNNCRSGHLDLGSLWCSRDCARGWGPGLPSVPADGVVLEQPSVAARMGWWQRHDGVGLAAHRPHAVCPLALGKQGLRTAASQRS